MRPCESAGVPSAGAESCIVSVSVVVAAASGAGNDPVPPNPFELGSVIVVAPAPGLSASVCIAETPNGVVVAVGTGATDVVPP
jgi:hypothetical protein